MVRAKAPASDEGELLARLRRREPEAFEALVRRHHRMMVAVAEAVLGSRAAAEDAAQDAWLKAVAAIGGFEGRSALSTWLAAIAVNTARNAARKEGRVRFVQVEPEIGGGDVRFLPDGHWREPPELWERLDPERIVEGRELWRHAAAAIERLSAAQRAVVVLRDVEGLEAPEVCTLLGLTAENQRVLLHRGREGVRRALAVLVERRTK